MKKQLLVSLLGVGMVFITFYGGKSVSDIHFYEGENGSGVRFSEARAVSDNDLGQTPKKIAVESPLPRYGVEPVMKVGVAAFFDDVESKSEERAKVIRGKIAWLEREEQRNQLREEYIHSGEVQMLAQLVRAEAGNQCQEGKERVVDVVLNRKDDPRFPDTIESVILQENQFSCLEDGNFKNAASIMDDSDYEAVLEELRLRDDEEVIYFTSGGYGKNGTRAYQLGDHYFCK